MTCGIEAINYFATGVFLDHFCHNRHTVAFFVWFGEYGVYELGLSSEILTRTPVGLWLWYGDGL